MIYTNFYSFHFYGPLADIYPNKSQVIIGALLELTNCVAVVGIAVMLFGILKRHNSHLALWYFGFRMIEVAVLIVGIISGLLLIKLSQGSIQAGAGDATLFQTMGSLALEGKHIGLQFVLVICGLGGLILTAMLYQSRIIPRFLSLWGFVGYVLVVASAILDLLGIIDTVHGNGVMMYIPGGLFEAIAFPLWLIIKGFASPGTLGESSPNP